MAFRRTGISPSLSGTCVPSSGEDFRSQIEIVAAVVGLRVAAAVVAVVVAQPQRAAFGRRLRVALHKEVHSAHPEMAEADDKDHLA